MREFLRGVADFFLAYSAIVSSKASLVWYVRRLVKALIFGTLAFAFYALALGFLIWELINWGQQVVPLPDAEGAKILVTVLLTGGFLFLTAGPWMYLSMALFLTTAQDWEGVRLVHPSGHKIFSEPLAMNPISLLRSFVRSLLLAIVIVICAILALIPIFLPLALLVNSYAIGREWLTSAREAYPSQRPRPRFSYSAGMGFVPALVSSVPIVGILALPILQMAAFEQAINQDTPSARNP